MRADARHPSDASPDQLYDAAVDVLTQLTERYAKAWWLRPRRSGADEAEPARSRPGGRRGRKYRAKMKLLEMTERSRLASHAVAMVLHAEARQTGRLRRRAGRTRAADEAADSDG